MHDCSCNSSEKQQKTEVYQLHLDAASGTSLGNGEFAFDLPRFDIPLHDVTEATIQVSRFHLESVATDNFESGFLLLKTAPQKYSWDSNLNGATSVIATIAQNQVPGVYIQNRDRDEAIKVNASDILGRRNVFQICIASGLGYQPLLITDWRATIILTVTY